MPQGYAGQSYEVGMEFVETIAPYVCKYAQEAGIHMAGFVIAQCCDESAVGTSSRAINQHNIVGDIMTGTDYGSWENCIRNYFTWDIVNCDQARAAMTFDEYAAVLFYGNNPYGYVYGEPEAVETLIRPAYDLFELERFNDASGEGSHLLDDFIEHAVSYVGTDEATWASMGKRYDPDAWCADFVSQVADEVGDILGVLFDASGSAHHCAYSVENYNGVVHLNDSSYTPQRGDLALVNDTGSGADHITILQEVSGDSLRTVEGNCDKAVREIDCTTSRFNCYCSPNWPASSGGGKSGVNGFNFSSLFEKKNTRKDAILREVGYLNKEYEPTTEETDIKLCVINYTELFEAFWDAGLRMKKAKVNVEYDYSKLESKVRTVVEYFTQKGYDPAVGCGIAACLQNKTEIDTTFKDENDADNVKVGVLPWPKKRAAKMQKRIGNDWTNNVTGQLDYLNFEIDSDYVDTFKNVTTGLNFSESTARVSASMFGYALQEIDTISDEAFNNKELAAKYFGLIVRKITYSSGNVKGSNGNSSSGGEYTYSGNEANASQAQKDLVSLAMSGSVPGSGGMCLQWVNDVYERAGYPFARYWGAIEVWRNRESAVLYGADMSNIPLGSCIVTTGSGSGGAGHIGIYIGNGEVISEVGGQRIESLDSFGSWASDYIDGISGMCGWVCPDCGIEWS